MTQVAITALIERDAVLAACLRACTVAVAGAQQIVFVVAGPGLGKTRLLAEINGGATAALRVLSAQGAALEQAVPFALLSQAFPYLRTAAGSDEVGPGELRARAFARTLDNLETTGPTVLLIDDLHWADLDSIALLDYLLRRTRTAGVAAIICVRPASSPGLELAHDLVAAGQATLHELSPLSDSGARDLLHAQLDDVDEALASRMNASCGGNPLLLEQLARSVAHGDTVDVGSSSAILLRRFAGVHADDLAFLRGAAVLGVEFRPEVAGELAGLAAGDLDRALDRLGALGLVVAAGRGRTRFAHPLFRQTLYDDLITPVRERMHARAFATLLQHGRPEAEAAEHALRGALVGDDRAIAVLESVAATARAAGATEVAREHLSAALELSAGPVRATQLIDLAQTDMALGRIGDAVDTLTRLLDLPGTEPGHRVRAMRGLGSANHEAGRPAVAAEWFSRAADEAERFDPDLAAEILLDHASMSQALPIPECLAVARRAQQLATPGSDLAARADILAAFVAMLGGDPSGIGAAEAAARRIRADADSGWSWSSSLRNLAHLTYMIERFDETDRLLTLAMASARAHGAPFTTASLAFAWTDALHRQGRRGELEQLRELIAGAATIAPAIGWTIPLLRCVIDWGVIPTEESDAAVAATTELFGDSGPWAFRAWTMLVAARQAMAAAHNHDASDLLLRVESLVTDAGLLEPCAVPWAAEAIRAHVSVGRRADAERVLRRLGEGAHGLPCRWPRIAQHVGAAALAEHCGDLDGADTHYRSALAMHADARLPHDRVQVLLAYGTFLRRHRSIIEARSALGDAAAIAREHGLTRLQHDAETELVGAGGRRRRAGEISRLTAQESRVCRLAADGLTNAAIAAHLLVSTKTVETHLSHAYNKLGIRTRGQLAAHLH